MGYVGSLDNGLLIEIKETIDLLNADDTNEKMRKNIYSVLPSMIEVCEGITNSARFNDGEILDGDINPFELQQRLYKLNNRNPYKKSW